MKLALVLLLAVAPCFGQPAPDSAGCIRPIARASSCIDVAVLKRPELQPSCLSELEIALRDEFEWEKCVTDNMAKRQESERKALVERAGDRRQAILQRLQIVIR